MSPDLEKILNDFQKAMMELRCSDCDGDGYTGTDGEGRKYSCETCGGHEDSIGDGLSRDVCWNDNPVRARLESVED